MPSWEMWFRRKLRTRFRARLVRDQPETGPPNCGATRRCTSVLPRRVRWRPPDLVQPSVCAHGVCRARTGGLPLARWRGRRQLTTTADYYLLYPCGFEAPAAASARMDCLLVRPMSAARVGGTGWRVHGST